MTPEQMQDAAYKVLSEMTEEMVKAGIKPAAISSAMAEAFVNHMLTYFHSDATDYLIDETARVMKLAAHHRIAAAKRSGKL